jgi:uncharacterized protein YuzE
VATTVPSNENINLDFDDRGRLVGIEILGSLILHPGLLVEISDAP